MNQVYGKTKRGDPDDPLEILAQYPAELLEKARKCLSYLEATDWKWDIVTLLKQPADLLEAVISLKVLGSEIRNQAQDKKDDG